MRDKPASYFERFLDTSDISDISVLVYQPAAYDCKVNTAHSCNQVHAGYYDCFV